MRYLLLSLLAFALFSCEDDNDIPLNQQLEEAVDPDAVTLYDRAVVYNEDLVEQGYYLFQPVGASNTYLLSTEGAVVYKWPGDKAYFMAYLREDGVLARIYRPDVGTGWNLGGQQGFVEFVDETSTVLNSYSVSSFERTLHHDIAFLPNGNYLTTVWNRISDVQAIEWGRNLAFLPDGEMYMDQIQEVDPSGAVVWEWNSWDHLVQDFDASKANFGNVQANPQLWDMNAVVHPNVHHFNGINYDPVRDLILVSSRANSEVYVIDHSTTMAEAATSSGGNQGMGGDIVYRWGNPQQWDNGTEADRKLFMQHDANPVMNSTSNGLEFTVFNNVFGTDISAVQRVVLPLDASGMLLDRSQLATNSPSDASYTYSSTAIYSSRVSGAMSLSPTSLAITNGVPARISEVDESVGVILELDVSDAADLFKARKYTSTFPGLPSNLAVLPAEDLD